MKKIFRIIIFLVIFCLLFLIVFKLLWFRKNPITYFYKEPKNSLDVVYIGASNTYAHFNTTLAYNEYGFTTGLLSYDSQPIIAAEYLIKEAEKYQKPKLYVIDLSKMASNFQDMEESAIRKVTDSMKMSKNRNNLLKKLLEYANVPQNEHINYYFSFFKYHENWKHLGQIKINLLGDKTLYKGYLYSDNTCNIEKQKYYIWPSEEKELYNDNIEVLESLFEYINNNKINVLFVVPKRTFNSDEEVYMLNYGVRLIRENGFEVINFNDLDDFDVDFNHDFYNFAHLNVWGATKYTLYFSRYLSENYDLPNHKNDKKYESWYKEYDRFKKDFNKTTGENFDDLLIEYKKSGY